MTITFFVPGIPAPGGSKRSFRHRHSGKIITREDCKRNPGWRSVVAASAMQAYSGPPLTGPLSLQVSFHMPRPKGNIS